MNRLLRAVLAPVAIVAITASVQAAEIPGKAITLPATERQVKVTYFRAPGDAKRPAVLLLHGAGGFDRRIADYNHYASVLANAGIDAYLFYYYNEQDDKMMSFGVDIFAQRYEA
jgi:carboxymethylenebutenolidase